MLNYLRLNNYFLILNRRRINIFLLRDKIKKNFRFFSDN